MRNQCFGYADLIVILGKKWKSLEDLVWAKMNIKQFFGFGIIRDFYVEIKGLFEARGLRIQSAYLWNMISASMNLWALCYHLNLIFQFVRINNE